jgi:hypothetical protein
VPYFDLAPRALRKDQNRCQACGTSAKPILAVHHVIPVALGGRDRLDNLTTLCANCHRIVHWLATGDRSLDAQACGLGKSATHTRHLLELARRIRTRRQRVIGPDLKLTTSVPLQQALGGIIRRNGLEGTEAAMMEHCFKLALRHMASSDRKACAIRRVRESRFISVNANNHLAIRAPAWNDRRQRIEGDIILAWPKAVRPSVIPASKFHRPSSSRGFKLVPHVVNLCLTWDECLSLSKRDWKFFREACHDALTFARSRRWTSNVTLD